MENFKNRLIVFAALFTLMLGFISCSDDDNEKKDKWVAGKIAFTSRLAIDPEVQNETSFELSTNLIQLTSAKKHDRIDNIQYRKGGFIEIAEDTKVHSVTLSLDNSKEKITLDMKYSDKGKFSDSDNDVYNFLNAVLERMKKDEGVAKVKVVGHTDETSLMDLNFQLNLDAHVVY